MSFYNCFNNFNFGRPMLNFSWFPMPNFSFMNFSFPYFNNFSFFSFNMPSFTPTFQNFNTTSVFMENTGYMPEFSFNNYSFSTPTFNTDTFVRTTKGRYSSPTDTLGNYNAAKGKKLADTALKNSDGFHKGCARYVSNALEEAGMSNGQRGHGYQMAGILRNNGNFKEISVDSQNYKDLPAGCILCYDKGAAGYDIDYGHVEITTGKGTAVSDGITQNIRKPSAIFVPV